MDSYYSLLAVMGVDIAAFEENKMDILRQLPSEIAVRILRMLDPPSLLAASLVCRKWLKLCRSDLLIRFQVKRQLRHERRMKIDPLRSEIVVLRDTREVKPLAPLNGRLQIFVQLDSDMPDEQFERKAAKKPVQRSRANLVTSQKQPQFSRCQSLRINECLMRRFITPWLKPDLFFKLSSVRHIQEKNLVVVRDFTRKVFEMRKEEWTYRHNSALSNEDSEDKCCTKRKHLALVDMLLEMSDNGRNLTDKDIQEEIDTFMFAGHDTTAIALSWCLYVLGHHLEAQDKILKEYERVTAESYEDFPTFKQLQKLEYLERCIKETMRLYPVTPLIARSINEPLRIMNHTLPEGVTALVNTYVLHRDPSMFPNPHVFDPDRFLPKNCEMRHPFAYVPFSAGPRNCIGMKFAMIELKIVLSVLLQNYQIQSVQPENELELVGELVLLNRHGIKLQIFPRK